MPAKSSTSPQRYRPEVEEAVARVVADLPGVRKASMFGHPAFFAGERMFACIYRQGVALKLPAQTLARLRGSPGIEPFEPYGKQMREWIVLVREDAEQYGADRDLIEEAARHVAAPDD